jgi:hypothetical protein
LGWIFFLFSGPVAAELRKFVPIWMGWWVEHLVVVRFWGSHAFRGVQQRFRNGSQAVGWGRIVLGLLQCAQSAPSTRVSAAWG